MTEPLQLLLIDDDDVDRMAVRRALQNAGLAFTLTEAVNDISASAVLKSAEFDCILIDYRLPGTDGLAVLRQLRAAGTHSPFIMLTGQGDEQLAVEIMKAGAADYLGKHGLMPERLAQSIRSAVRVARAEVQTESARQESLDRLRFLADVSYALASSLDPPTIVSTLVTMVVPTLADWCVVDLLQPDGSLHRAAVATNPDVAPEWAETLLHSWPLAADASYGPPAVISQGTAAAYPPIALDGDEINDDDQPDALRVAMALCVPLIVPGKTHGALSLLAAPPRRFHAADLVMASNISLRAAVALDNAHHYQQAREAIRIRDEFLSIASHEFKTPLTSLIGNTQLIERRLERAGHLSDRDQRALRTINDQAMRLNRMINSLLDVSHLQSGQLAIQHSPVELRALVTQLVDEMRPSLSEHQIVLSGCDTPIIIIGDELRLHQVMQNLLQNAVKYSPQGGLIEVILEQNDHWGVVSVSDHGIGIPAESLPKLFRRFYRGENAQAQPISGIGLGLYVVNEIVSLHGGHVEVTSQEGQGSTFTIQLPLRSQELR